ncbi:MAG: type I-B CRISPR-associated protein Cas8b1/Cst1 [Promethearchaeota archaeon]
MDLFSLTGNCFIDAGIYVLLNLTRKKRPNDITVSDLQPLIETLVEIYISDTWKGTLTQIFPNSKIANFSIKDRKTAYNDFLNELLANFESLDGQRNTCWGCNRREGTIYATRAEFPLTGAKKVVNFFPTWDDGIKICPNCLFAVQFSPLVMTKCTDKLLFLHSDSELVMRTWTSELMRSINSQIMSNKYLGVNDFGYKNSTNFFLEMATKIINNYHENWVDERPFIRLYMFTNFLKSPRIEFIDIPTRVFLFLAYIKQSGLIKDWNDFIHSWTYKSSKDNKRTAEELIKIRRNYVFENLLQDKPITRYFILYFKKYNKKLKWELIELYAMEVLKMKKESLDYIKKLGDLIVELMRKMESKKRLVQLETSKNIGQFRGVLLQLEKDCLVYEDEPIFKLDEVVEYLFPETEYGINWREMRDFLLLRIYEVGFEFLKQFKKEIEYEIAADLQEKELEEIDMEE